MSWSSVWNQNLGPGHLGQETSHLAPSQAWSTSGPLGNAEGPALTLWQEGCWWLLVILNCSFIGRTALFEWNFYEGRAQNCISDSCSQNSFFLELSVLLAKCGSFLMVGFGERGYIMYFEMESVRVCAHEYVRYPDSQGSAH